jgi:hypothetical protein
VQEQIMEDRWQRAQRREAIAENNQQFALMNRRFATVVSSEDFARSRPVQRVAIRVPADKIATAPVAFVAAPPSPTVSIRAVQAPGDKKCRSEQRAPERSKRTRPGQCVDDPDALCQHAGHQAGAEREKAPGPKFVSRGSQTDADQKNKAALPQLAPRNEAVAPVKIEGERKPADGQPGQPAEANAPGARPTTNLPGMPPRPGESNRPDQRPGQPPQANAPAIAPPWPRRRGRVSRTVPSNARVSRRSPARRTCRRYAIATISAPTRRERATPSATSRTAPSHRVRDSRRSRTRPAAAASG